MTELLAATLGAVVGGGVSALTAWGVYAAERRRRGTDSLAALRRDLTVALVHDLADLRECIANPSRNRGRMANVESSLAATYAVFVGHLDLQREAPVSEFVHRLKNAVRYASATDSVWSDEETLRKQAIEPLLRWSTGDDTYRAGWFASHLSESQTAFSRKRFEIEPIPTRRELRK